MSRRSFDLTLYLVAGQADCGSRPLEEVVAAAVAGGVTLVQLREKGVATRTHLERARGLKRRLAPTGVPLLINDRIDVALAAGVDGVHLGQDDMPPAQARALMGEEAIIGLSAGDAAEAGSVDPALVDYAGVGPAYATGTKSDAGAAIGVEGVGDVMRRVGVPVVAIGGITAETAGALVAAGAAGVAVVSAVCAAADPEAAARVVRRAVERARMQTD